MSDAPPDPVPSPPPPSGAVMQELQDLSHKVDLVAGALATIAAGHHELLDHVAESVARQSHDSLEIVNRLSAIERQVLATGPDAAAPDTAVADRLDAIERAVSALPGAAPGVESTFVALADRLDALADGEREGRETIAALTTAVEALTTRSATDERDDDGSAAAPDLRAELQALTDAQRAVADELAALGPRVNELLDRHPDGLPVPPPPPADDVIVPDEVTPPPSTEIDLAPLQGQVADLAEVTAGQANDLALALEVLSKVAEAIDRLDARTEDRLAAVRDASMTPVADLQALLVGRSERSDAQMQEIGELLAALIETQATLTEPAPVDGDADDGEPEDDRLDDAPAPDAAVLEKLDDVAQAVQSLTWQLPELADAVAALRPEESDDDDDDDDLPLSAEPAAAGSAAVLARLDDLVTAMDDLVPDPTALDARLDELTRTVAALSTTPPPTVLAPPTTSSDPLLEARLTHHIDTALAGVLRLFDDRLVALRASLSAASPMSTVVAPVGPPPGAMGGFEAGAVMGAAQAAWTRLEQRLDEEFDDLSRQLQALVTLVEQAVASTESLANRPVVTSDQMRRAAVNLRDTVVNANRQRRERRGGPKGLGPGSSGY